jgi:preprotein translocase subunit SecA
MPQPVFHYRKVLMSEGITLLDRAKYALGRLREIPVEADLSPYEPLVTAAEGQEFSGLGESSLLVRAQALRASLDAEELEAPAVGFNSGPAPLLREAESLSACIALAAEAVRRGLGLDPFHGQLVAAAAMCQGKVVQLQTGEGKTLAAAIAASFCAMRDGFVHVLTANDYLARRDAAWMSPVYKALGLSVASVESASSADERRRAYEADVLYLTARELGFDYLRDGLARDRGALVQRGFRSAIVDEADFILIDEARIPLVIAGELESPGISEMIRVADELARAFVPGVHYNRDAEGRKVFLSEAGEAMAASRFGFPGMHEPRAEPAFARLHAALHAWTLLQRDIDYVVKEGAVHPVDAFTGRIAERRQWPWGVQAALEAKEGIAIGREGRVYGSIAIQHLIGLYPKRAAMTATALPAAAEFLSAYGMGTVLVPSERPSRRIDEPDALFWDRKSKREALVAAIESEWRRGRPVLVGTASVRESEELAALLSALSLPCVVLNAREDEREAALIASAGQRGAITISTDMAGRGTDIALGPGVAALGGLCVIGTERHESRRMDDQLRGRAGRQGDPGSSRFYVSLEDELFEGRDLRGIMPPAVLMGQGGRSGSIEDEGAIRAVGMLQSIVAGENAKTRLALRKYSLLVEYDRRYSRALREGALVHGSLPPSVEACLAAPASTGIAGEIRSKLTMAFIARLDEAWAGHLAAVEDFKEGMSLLRYGNMDPGIEYVNAVGSAFESRMEELEEATRADCLRLLSGSSLGPVEEGLPACPSSTWTYSVEEDALPQRKGSALSGISALVLGPLALPLFLLERLARARRGKERG